MMDLKILGIGTVCALGQGVDTLKNALKGERAPVLERQDLLEGLLPPRALRRMDPFTRSAVLASFLALQDSGRTLDEGATMGIVFGTAFGLQTLAHGFHDSLIDDGDACASPTLFATSLHNSLATQTSLLLKTTGPTRTVSSLGLTLAGVLWTAEEWIGTGLADFVLAGVGEETSPMRRHLSHGLGCKKESGEGFVVFLLGRGENPGGYGRLRKVETGVNHDPSCFALITPNPASGHPLARNYQSLFGCSPAAVGFDLAIAALSLKEGLLPPEPGAAEPCALPHDARIACLSKGTGSTYVELSR